MHEHDLCAGTHTTCLNPGPKPPVIQPRDNKQQAGAGTSRFASLHPMLVSHAPWRDSPHPMLGPNPTMPGQLYSAAVHGTHHHLPSQQRCQYHDAGMPRQPYSVARALERHTLSKMQQKHDRVHACIKPFFSFQHLRSFTRSGSRSRPVVEPRNPLETRLRPTGVEPSHKKTCCAGVHAGPDCPTDHDGVGPTCPLEPSTSSSSPSSPLLCAIASLEPQ